MTALEFRCTSRSSEANRGASAIREIDVEIDVFALIWALREPPESTENEILKRILSEFQRLQAPSKAQTFQPKQHRKFESEEVYASSRSERKKEDDMSAAYGKVRWVDDVRAALTRLGGVASLYEIYKKVEEIRKAAGRSVPRSLEATVRRTIEDHSSDSENFRGVDLFKKISRGEWGLRDKQA